jgi:DNA (cytosine-5)-methyltransferase 1
LQGYLRSRRAKGKGFAADAEGGARGGCYWNGEQVAATLTRKGCDDRMPDKERMFAVLQPTAGTLGNRGLRSHTELDGHGAYIPVAQPVPFTKAKRAQSTSDDETWVDGQVNPTLSLFDQGDTRATTVAVAFHPTQDPISSTDGSTHCMGTGSSRGDATIAVAQSMTVRRLTPRECERLQGFPDDWTMIPYRGKPAEQCPDGPRYKALGNSMACNCMAWIGERIAAYENYNR